MGTITNQELAIEARKYAHRFVRRRAAKKNCCDQFRSCTEFWISDAAPDERARYCAQ